VGSLEIKRKDIDLFCKLLDNAAQKVLFHQWSSKAIIQHLSNTVIQKLAHLDQNNESSAGCMISLCEQEGIDINLKWSIPVYSSRYAQLTILGYFQNLPKRQLELPPKYS
jgi:hypothetical protein